MKQSNATVIILFSILLLSACAGRIRPDAAFRAAQPRTAALYTVSTNETADLRTEDDFAPARQYLLKRLFTKGYSAYDSGRIRSNQLEGQSWMDYRPGRRAHVAEMLARRLGKEAGDDGIDADSVILLCSWDQQPTGKRTIGGSKTKKFARTEIWWWSVTREAFILVDYIRAEYGTIHHEKSKLLKEKRQRLYRGKVKITRTYGTQKWSETIPFSKAVTGAVKKMSKNIPSCRQ
jgi:hypothetical protein